MGQYVCEECRESVEPNASTCPHCGHDPGKGEMMVRTVYYLLASLSFFSIIGIPLGVFLVWRARKRTQRAKEASPAVEV